MKTYLKLPLTGLLVLMLLVGFTGMALAFDSGEKPGDIGSNTITWTGQGASNGELDETICPSTDTVPAGIDPGSYLHWIFTTDGGSAENAVLHLGGSGSGDYTGTATGGAFHFFTPYFVPDSNLTAYATFDVITTGNGAWILTISHGCPGVDYEELTVDKTVETSFTRTHDWSIDKSVDTENGYTHDGFPKVWLYIDGHGNETATWTVDVTYEGYEDSDWNVSGDITIENTGTLDAVITSVDDVLAGAPIAVDCGLTFPYTLPVGETLTCTYDQDGYVDGFNVATVTTERDNYSSPEVPIAWGEPTTEVNKTVTVKDISDLFGEVELGTVTAPDNAQFTYTKDFAWADYGEGLCGDYIYDNTATIVETGVSASATLKVNVQCYIYETAYAKGNAPTCFMPTFSNWGWTNYIPGRGNTYTWNLWAGAGQCDTSKGTLVGTVRVVYGANGYVTVTYNVSSPYSIKETHVYAGTTKFPMVKIGKKSVATVAPGLYYNKGPFSGPIYVIAHAVVGIPDPNFGP